MILIVSAALLWLILLPRWLVFAVRACAKGGGALFTGGDIIHWWGHYSLVGTLFSSEKCLGEQYSPVNNVRGNIIHGGTLFTPTTSHWYYCELAHAI